MRRNLGGICSGDWSEFATPKMLRRESADKQGEGGAERLVGGAKVARNHR